MPKQITGTNQPSIELNITIPVSGDITSAARMEALLQHLVNNDASLKHLIDSLAITSGTGLDGADAGVGIGAVTLSIANQGVDTQQLADEAVTTAKLDDASVTTAKVNDAAITTAKVNDAAITTAKVNDDAIDNDKIADNAVDTDQINDDAVENAQIANNAVDTDQINDDAVTVNKLDGTTTGTAGQLVEVAANNMFAFSDKPPTNSLGQLIATSSTITGNNGAHSPSVTAWILEQNIPAGITIDEARSPAWADSMIPLSFPLIPPTNRTIGLWCSLENASNTEVSRFFLPWGYFETHSSTASFSNISGNLRERAGFALVDNIRRTTPKNYVVIFELYAGFDINWLIGFNAVDGDTRTAAVHNAFTIKVYLALN